MYKYSATELRLSAGKQTLQFHIYTVKQYCYGIISLSTDQWKLSFSKIIFICVFFSPLIYHFTISFIANLLVLIQKKKFFTQQITILVTLNNVQLQENIKYKDSYLVQIQDNIVMTRLQPLAHEQSRRPSPLPLLAPLLACFRSWYFIQINTSYHNNTNLSHSENFNYIF